MKFSIKDSFSKCDKIGSFLWIWTHLLEKSLMENFIFVERSKSNESIVLKLSKSFIDLSKTKSLLDNFESLLHANLINFSDIN